MTQDCIVYLGEKKSYDAVRSNLGANKFLSRQVDIAINLPLYHFELDDITEILVLL